jgi:chemotaxis signal transduction protein
MEKYLLFHVGHACVGLKIREVVDIVDLTEPADARGSVSAPGGEVRHPIPLVDLRSHHPGAKQADEGSFVVVVETEYTQRPFYLALIVHRAARTVECDGPADWLEPANQRPADRAARGAWQPSRIVDLKDLLTDGELREGCAVHPGSAAQR